MASPRKDRRPEPHEHARNSSSMGSAASRQCTITGKLSSTAASSWGRRMANCSARFLSRKRSRPSSPMAHLSVISPGSLSQNTLRVFSPVLRIQRVNSPPSNASREIDPQGRGWQESPKALHRHATTTRNTRVIVPLRNRGPHRNFEKRCDSDCRLRRELPYRVPKRAFRTHFCRKLC